MICPYCQKEAKWCENKAIYGKNYGRSYMCYYCKDCDAYVGCHNNTKKPLGTMANAKLRELRKQCHKLFDPLWKTGKMNRHQAYSYLEKETGVRHIGEANESQCEKILQYIK